MLLMKNVPRREVIESFVARFPQLDPSAVEACLVMLRTATELHDALESHFARNGISQGRFSILMHLLRADDNAMTPAELAEAIGVTRATVTGLVDGLERDRLITRTPHPSDRRSLFVRLTDNAQTFLAKMLPDHFRRISGLMDGLTKKERRELTRLLDKVKEGISALVDGRQETDR